MYGAGTTKTVAQKPTGVSTEGDECSGSRGHYHFSYQVPFKRSVIFGLAVLQETSQEMTRDDRLSFGGRTSSVCDSVLYRSFIPQLFPSP